MWYDGTIKKKEGTKMKKIALLAAALVMTASAASAVSIVGSKHDLSTATGANGAANELCVYCHTPHNPKLSIPLWNRNNPAGASFSLYKTSPTLTSFAKASALADTSISLFCMSCHDGNTAYTDVKNNYSGGAGDTAKMSGTWGAAGNPKLGTDLTNSHPIGFSYTAAQGEDSGLNAASTVMATYNTKAGAGATTAQAFLYGTGADQMECASCHRVHDPGYLYDSTGAAITTSKGKFLRIPNKGSDLCLACHKK